ncbi:MAG: sialate O-acetylesterase [Prevotellaceae bacterium]|jgi:sialate O-acetylesterase|nr:sialate O-acetylesterase [Prevotellaceae bacterium]
MRKIFFLLVTSIAASQLFAVSLPHIFSDNMVLAQNAEVPVWGFGKAGEEIALTASWQPEKTLHTVADADGKWQILLKTPSGSFDNYIIDIQGYNHIQFTNVQIGELWFVSGQSNMEMSADWGIDNMDAEIAATNYPDIRFFKTDYRTAEFPQQDLGGAWEVCTPQAMRNFSAIGYFFARNLRKEINLPVGVICSAWGGTYIESWIPAEAFANNEFLREGASEITPVQWGPSKHSVLYNAMVAPIIPYKINGILWYQGEQNTANPQYYREMLTALISQWREKWNSQNLPFYFAQIAPFNYGNNFSGVEIRNAQLQVALNVPNTAMIMTSDICTTDDIHPKNKQEAGKRFADIAIKNYKNKCTISFTPLPKLFRNIDTVPETLNIKKAKNNSVILLGNLHFKSKSNNLFEIAGKDGVYYRAKVEIKSVKKSPTGEKYLEFFAPEVLQPVSVRYAWENTALPDLFNDYNLPLSSFELKIE